MIDSVFKALFLPGFTLAPTVNRRKDGTFFIIWCAARHHECGFGVDWLTFTNVLCSALCGVCRETGIAARSAPPSTVEIDGHRTEALKLLLVLNSGGLYLNPGTEAHGQKPQCLSCPLC